jgi:hypothetical protein
MRRGVAYNERFKLQRTFLAFDGGQQSREGLWLGFGLPADELAVVGGSGRAGAGQEIDGLEEVALALGVIADEEEASRRQ